MRLAEILGAVLFLAWVTHRANVSPLLIVDWCPFCELRQWLGYRLFSWALARMKKNGVSWEAREVLLSEVKALREKK